MASAIYPKAKESFLSQNPSIDMDTDTIKVCLVDLTTDYTYGTGHQFKTSVPSYPGSTDATITPKTVTDGAFDSTGTPTFTSLSQSASKTVGALVIYKDTGSAATSPVIAYIDGFTPVVPNGGDITITWDTSPSYIFSL